MIIVYTTGVFDLLHPGHLSILRRAKAMGDKLVVGVQDDLSVKNQKGKPPVMNCLERITMLESLPFVDVVLPYHNLDQREMLKLINPDVMIQGEDWLKTGDRKEIIKYLKKNKIRLIQFPFKYPYKYPFTRNISATKIKKRIKKNGKNP